MHWRGELLGTVKKALGLARSMTYKLIKLKVKLVRKIYKNGITLTKQELEEVEQNITRKEGLEKWFFTIQP